MKARALLVGDAMIAFLHASARSHDGPKDSGVWATFNESGGMGAFIHLEEHVLLPQTRTSPWSSRGVLLTYVREGCVACEGAGVLRSTEVQVVTDGVAPWSVCNRSADRARVFQLMFAPAEPLMAATLAQRRFAISDRRGKWRLLASPDAREGSLLLLARARVYSTLLHDGSHMVHALDAGCSAWLHVVDGGCAVGGAVLRKGDAAGFVDERSVSLTARGDTELLLIEVLT